MTTDRIIAAAEELLAALKAEREPEKGRIMRSSPPDPELDTMLDRAKANPPSEEELRAQRESWVRGEMGLGLDRDEARHRSELETERKEWWIGPFPWRGGETNPVPGRICVRVRYRGAPDRQSEGLAEGFGWRHDGASGDIVSFSYRADNAAGWTERPAGWVPPDETWSLGLHWSTSTNPAGHGGARRLTKSDWDASPPITHIRLLPRETKPAVPDLPEWAIVESDGWLAVKSHNGQLRSIIPELPADHIERIAEACRIYAARLRAEQ